MRSTDSSGQSSSSSSPTASSTSRFSDVTGTSSVGMAAVESKADPAVGKAIARKAGAGGAGTGTVKATKANGKGKDTSRSSNGQAATGKAASVGAEASPGVQQPRRPDCAIDGCEPTAQEKERRRRQTRKRRRRRLDAERVGIEASADRLATLLQLGEVPKVRPYGKEGFMSMAVTHEMFAIDEAFAPLTSPSPRPVSTNPVWSCFAAKYLLPTVSSFHACPTPWSDYAATLHACERTLYWSKFCEGGAGPVEGKAGAEPGEGMGKYWSGKEIWEGGPEVEWTQGCANMATVQARRMVEWPFDPRKTADGTWFLSACSFLSVLLCWSRRAPSIVIGPYLARTLSSRIRSLLNACPSPPPAPPSTHTPSNAKSAAVGSNGVAPASKTAATGTGVLSHPYDRPMLERLMTFLPLPEPLGRDAVGFGKEASCCGKEGCLRELGDGLGYEGSGKGVAGTVATVATQDVHATPTPPPWPSPRPDTLKEPRTGTGREQSELKQCSACRAIVYCGRQHQKDDWRKRHSKHCWATAITHTAPFFGQAEDPLYDDREIDEEDDFDEEDGDLEADASTLASESYDGSSSPASSTHLGLYSAPPPPVRSGTNGRQRNGGITQAGGGATGKRKGGSRDCDAHGPLCDGLCAE